MTLWVAHSQTTLFASSGWKHTVCIVNTINLQSYQNMDLRDSFYPPTPPHHTHIHTHSICILTSFEFNKIIITTVARTQTCRKLGGGKLYERRGFFDGRHLWNICERCWVDTPVILVTHGGCNPLEKPLTQNTLLSVKCTSLWDRLTCPHRIIRLIWACIDRWGVYSLSVLGT